MQRLRRTSMCGPLAYAVRLTLYRQREAGRIQRCYMQRYYIHTQCAICNTQHTKCDMYKHRICGYRSGTAPTASWLLHVVLRDERCMLPVARCMRYIACLMLLVACCIWHMVDTLRCTAVCCSQLACCKMYVAQSSACCTFRVRSAPHACCTEGV